MIFFWFCHVAYKGNSMGLSLLISTYNSSLKEESEVNNVEHLIFNVFTIIKLRVQTFFNRERRYSFITWSLWFFDISCKLQISHQLEIKWISCKSYNRDNKSWTNTFLNKFKQKEAFMSASNWHSLIYC